MCELRNSYISHYVTKQQRHSEVETKYRFLFDKKSYKSRKTR